MALDLPVQCVMYQTQILSYHSLYELYSHEFLGTLYSHAYISITYIHTYSSALPVNRQPNAQNSSSHLKFIYKTTSASFCFFASFRNSVLLSSHLRHFRLESSSAFTTRLVALLQMTSMIALPDRLLDHHRAYSQLGHHHSAIHSHHHNSTPRRQPASSPAVIDSAPSMSRHSLPTSTAARSTHSQSNSPSPASSTLPNNENEPRGTAGVYLPSFANLTSGIEQAAPEVRRKSVASWPGEDSSKAHPASPSTTKNETPQTSATDISSAASIPANANYTYDDSRVPAPRHRGSSSISSMAHPSNILTDLQPSTPNTSATTPVLTGKDDTSHVPQLVQSRRDSPPHQQYQPYSTQKQHSAVRPVQPQQSQNPMEQQRYSVVMSPHSVVQTPPFPRYMAQQPPIAHPPPPPPSAPTQTPNQQDDQPASSPLQPAFYYSAPAVPYPGHQLPTQSPQTVHNPPPLPPLNQDSEFISRIGEILETASHLYHTASQFQTPAQQSANAYQRPPPVPLETLDILAQRCRASADVLDYWRNRVNYDIRVQQKQVIQPNQPPLPQHQPPPQPQQQLLQQSVPPGYSYPQPPPLPHMHAAAPPPSHMAPHIQPPPPGPAHIHGFPQGGPGVGVPPPQHFAMAPGAPPLHSGFPTGHPVDSAPHGMHERTASEAGPIHFKASPRIRHYSFGGVPGNLQQPPSGPPTPGQQHLQQGMLQPGQQAKRLTPKKRARDVLDSTVCHHCGTSETPEWRRGPDGARTLCNACGLYHAKMVKKNGPLAAAEILKRKQEFHQQQKQQQQHHPNSQQQYQSEPDVSGSETAPSSARNTRRNSPAL